MIQTITTYATAICDNCGGQIRRTRGDLERTESWTHAINGKSTCPQAPEAEPMEETVQEASITCPRCGMTSFNPNDVSEGYCGNCHDYTGQDNPGSKVFYTQWIADYDVAEGKQIWSAFCGGCGVAVATAHYTRTRPMFRPVHIHPPTGITREYRNASGICLRCGVGPDTEHTDDCPSRGETHG